MSYGPKFTETSRAGIVCAGAGRDSLRTWRAYCVPTIASESPVYRYCHASTRESAIRKVSGLPGIQSVISIYREG